MKTENSKTSERHKLILSLLQILDLKNPYKYTALQSLSIFYTWKNIRQQYKNNKAKKVAPKWNDEFELPDGFCSVSDIQDYIDYIIKKHETLTDNPPNHIYVNKVNNRPVFKIKDENKLELKTPETMTLFDSTKKKKNNRQNKERTSLEVIEVVLVQCNLVYNQYQQKSEVLYTFMPNKSYGYLLNVELNNLVFLKTYNTEFDHITITFVD